VITEFIQRVLPDSPMMLMIVGFHSEDKKSGPRLEPPHELVDLDEVTL